jgi:large subunit ribosomal protein L10
MNREEKSAAIQEIAAEIEASEAIFAVDYRGISVSQAAELRSKLREADASFRIVKNRLTKIAADNAGEARLAELLQGPTALTFVRGDTAQAAKTITSFNKEHDVLTFKGGFMDGTSLDEDAFKAISRLPGRDVLNGQLAGVVASPLTGLVRGLGSMIQGLALQLGQIAEKGLVTGEAPSESAAGPVAEEAAEDDSGGADAPVEEAPTESSAGNEPPAEGDPSKPEGEDDESAQPEPPTDESAGDDESAEAPDETSEQEEQDETSTEDASKEEE